MALLPPIHLKKLPARLNERDEVCVDLNNFLMVVKDNAAWTDGDE